LIIILKLIRHHILPEYVFVISEKITVRPDDQPGRRRQEQSDGDKLTEKAAVKYLNARSLNISRTEGEKPVAWDDEGKQVFISRSHTTSMLAAAVSRTCEVGIDIEHKNRNIHYGLANRIRHREEPADLYEPQDVLRLWTIKEAALKWHGSGLRTRMSSVCVSAESENQFHAHFDNGMIVKICSFADDEHLISVAYK